MKPGIYNHTFEEYRMVDALHISQLKPMARSAKHFKHDLDTPRTPSQAMILGTALHTAVLEPEKFAKEYIFIPDMPLRSKADKDAFKAVCLEIVSHRGLDVAGFEGFSFHNEEGRTAFFHALTKHGITILPDSEMSRVLAMSRAIGEHSSAHFWINAKGQNEASGYWRDSQTGVLCCARFDKIVSEPQPVIVEIKTTQDAREEYFMRDFAKFGYGMQAAWYLWGAKTITGKTHAHITIAVESEPPYGVAVYMLGDTSLEFMHAKNRSLLNKYAECKRSGIWPGYKDEIIAVDLKKWDLK